MQVIGTRGGKIIVDSLPSTARECPYSRRDKKEVYYCSFNYVLCSWEEGGPCCFLDTDMGLISPKKAAKHMRKLIKSSSPKERILYVLEVLERCGYSELVELYRGNKEV